MKAAGTLAFFLWLAAAPARAGEVIISIQPAELYQGGVAEIKILGGGIADVKAERGGADFPVYRAGGDAYLAYIALLGIDLEQRPGPIAIALRGRAGGASWTKRAIVTVKAREFPREEISVPESFDQLDRVALKRIEKEQAALDRLWKIRTGRLWDGAFVAPVPITVNSAFGFRRVINGAARAPHTGTDLKAALGAEVVATNHGKIVLRDDFFFSGLSLVLDHGGGLYTMYFHLSEFRAENGAEVRKGEVIGLAGMTGRVTGPHLHWGARLDGARVDPMELLKIESQN